LSYKVAKKESFEEYIGREEPPDKENKRDKINEGNVLAEECVH